MQQNALQLRLILELYFNISRPYICCAPRFLHNFCILETLEPQIIKNQKQVKSNK